MAVNDRGKNALYSVYTGLSLFEAYIKTTVP